MISIKRYLSIIHGSLTSSCSSPRWEASPCVALSVAMNWVWVQSEHNMLGCLIDLPCPYIQWFDPQQLLHHYWTLYLNFNLLILRLVLFGSKTHREGMDWGNRLLRKPTKGLTNIPYHVSFLSMIKSIVMYSQSMWLRVPKSIPFLQVNKISSNILVHCINAIYMMHYFVRIMCVNLNRINF